MKRRMFSLKTFIYSPLFLGLPSLLNAQIDLSNTREGESVEYCVTHKKLNELLKNPEFKQQYLLDQQALADLEVEMVANSDQKRNVLYIPIVFHVLHQGGTENITDEQIMDALAILNRDFRKLNADANQVQSEFNASNPDRVAQP